MAKASFRVEDLSVSGTLNTHAIPSGTGTIALTSDIPSSVDSAYVNARLDTTLFLDSVEAIALVDSSYVQVRQTPQDFTYASLTGKPNILDSNHIISIIGQEGIDSDLTTQLVDSAYIQLRDRFQDSSLVTSTVDATYINARLDTSLFLDSTETIALIDSAYVNARLDITSFLDSAETIALIDSAYVSTRVGSTGISETEAIALAVALG
tara:strand:+ start:87 stop:713 length:627 start_codon:yes stop_codon:yes gene_type:complete